MALARCKGYLNVTMHHAPGMIDRAKLMDQAPGDHPDLFSDPDPPGPAFNAQIVATDAAQVAVAKGGKGAADLRDVQLGLLHGMMERRLVYLQGKADAGPRANAAATLRAGGVEVISHTPRDKPILAAKQDFAGAPVYLEANARALLGVADLRRKHLFSWGYTIDGGKTFISLPPTPRGRTIVNGLAPMTTVGFRVAVTFTDGSVGPWSAVIELLVR